MKFIVLVALGMVTSVAAWGSVRTYCLTERPTQTPVSNNLIQVEFCLNSPDDNPGYNCATYTFSDTGCYTLPSSDGGWQRPNLRGNTHYVALSSHLLCNVFR